VPEFRGAGSARSTRTSVPRLAPAGGLPGGGAWTLRGHATSLLAWMDLSACIPGVMARPSASRFKMRAARAPDLKGAGLPLQARTGKPARLGEGHGWETAGVVDEADAGTRPWIRMWRGRPDTSPSREQGPQTLKRDERASEKAGASSVEPPRAQRAITAWPVDIRGEARPAAGRASPLNVLLHPRPRLLALTSWPLREPPDQAA
jgi:hypothetical protein